MLLIEHKLTISPPHYETEIWVSARNSNFRIKITGGRRRQKIQYSLFYRHIMDTLVYNTGTYIYSFRKWNWTFINDISTTIQWVQYTYTIHDNKCARIETTVIFIKLVSICQKRNIRKKIHVLHVHSHTMWGTIKYSNWCLCIGRYVWYRVLY